MTSGNGQVRYYRPNSCRRSSMYRRPSIGMSCNDAIIVIRSDKLGRDMQLIFTVTWDHATNVVNVTIIPPLVIRNLSVFPLQYWLPGLQMGGVIRPYGQRHFYIDSKVLCHNNRYLLIDCRGEHSHLQASRVSQVVTSCLIK